MLDGLLDYLIKRGLNVRPWRRDIPALDAFILNRQRRVVPWLTYDCINIFRLTNGIITCTRGDKLNLADPRSLNKLVRGLKFCANSPKCIECPMRNTDWIVTVTDEMYEFITTKCKTNCEDLCGRFGIMYCPLK